MLGRVYVEASSLEKAFGSTGNGLKRVVSGGDVGGSETIAAAGIEVAGN